MGARANIIHSLEELRVQKEELTMLLYSSPDSIMPSEVGEYVEAIKDIEKEMDDLEIEYHKLTALIWAKGEQEHGTGES